MSCQRMQTGSNRSRERETETSQTRKERKNNNITEYVPALQLGHDRLAQIHLVGPVVARAGHIRRPFDLLFKRYLYCCIK
jgi:hypothetical protein